MTFSGLDFNIMSL